MDLQTTPVAGASVTLYGESGETVYYDLVRAPRRYHTQCRGKGSNVDRAEQCILCAS